MDFPLLRAGTHSDRPFLPMGQIRRGGVPPVDIAPRIPVRVILVIQMIRSLILRQSVRVIDPMLPRPKMIPRPKLHTHPSRNMITQKGGKSEGGKKNGTGGRGGFSERSPSPPRPLSPEEQLGFESLSSFKQFAPEGWARFLVRRNQLCRSNPAKRQLLFGSRGLGRRRLLSEKPPPP